MGALFAKKLFGRRASPDATELALDLTAEAIILHERPSHGAWKKFASAQLDFTRPGLVALNQLVELVFGSHHRLRRWSGR